MTPPTVSVCLPTFNYASFLPRAIESVLNQTFDDLELIVCDDASSDNTVEVMQQYLNDERVTFVAHEQNRGQAANFNQCIEHAQGRYVKYLCADDWLDERFLAETVPLLEGSDDLVMATTANWLVDIDGQLIGEQHGPFGDGPRVAAAEVAAALAEWGNVVGMPTNTLIRRDALVAVNGFDADYAPAIDIHLWLKLLTHGDMGWVPRQRCFIRIHFAHSHSYGSDPTESIFLVWRDASELPGTPVSPQLARHAFYREALRVELYVAAHLLRLRVGRARKLLAFTARHVSMVRATLSFIASLPRTALDQARRLRALRSRHMIVYGPRPHRGKKLAAARAELAAEQSSVESVE
ncbi:MAG: glycosyltransferase family 2 protein [Thermoleophilia bacterium]|nr:glycosyltransferase family 2 protein [Thermoleophilia bacterium]